MISFNKPPYVGEEIKYIEEAVKAQKIYRKYNLF